MTQNDVIMQNLLIEIKNYLDAVIPSFECSESDEFRTIDDVKKWGKMPDFYAELERQIQRHSIVCSPKEMEMYKQAKDYAESTGHTLVSFKTEIEK